MKRQTLYTGFFTSLFAGMMLFSAVPDVLSDPIAVKGMHEGLGYPLYFIPFIGVAKVLGVIAILVPRFPRLKEWAYAGLFFDLIGATFSIAAVGRPDWMFMFVPFGLGIASYLSYQKKRRRQEARRIELKRAAALNAA